MNSVPCPCRRGFAGYWGESKRLGLVLLCTFAASAAAANQPTFTLALGAGVTIAPLAVDAQGNTYVAGTTEGGIPTTAGAFQTGFTLQSCPTPVITILCGAAFVMKLDPSGAIVRATCLDGSYGSSANAIAVDGGERLCSGDHVEPRLPHSGSSVEIRPSNVGHLGGQAYT